ncbi:hypothetical protein [Thermococcus sp.]|uniref:hypothetical protein n=1 Tax=Thermococcus sp. TaxID=35749 RepID=UPI0026356E48|nr:hypothetical protein [Thermococcus sp.]
MDERTIKTIEYSAEALLIAWFAYMFFYQNYILHTWHRGLPLPSKLPFLLLGVLSGAIFFWYEYRKMEGELVVRKAENIIPPEETGDVRETPVKEQEKN